MQCSNEKCILLEKKVYHMKNNNFTLQKGNFFYTFKGKFFNIYLSPIMLFYLLQHDEMFPNVRWGWNSIYLWLGCYP